MIDLTREGALARIFLDRPEKANALDSRLLDALSTALEALAGDETVRVVVLGGTGRTFCGGADVEELARLDASTAGAFVGRIHRACAALRRLPVPVVARLQEISPVPLDAHLMIEHVLGFPNLNPRWARQLEAGGELSVQAYFDRTERTVRKIVLQSADRPGQHPVTDPADEDEHCQSPGRPRPGRADRSPRPAPPPERTPAP